MRTVLSLLTVAALAVAQTPAESVAQLEVALAQLDARIKVADRNAKTALGAAQLEKLRAKREAVLQTLRRLKQPKKEVEEVELPDIRELLVKAGKGDVACRNALLKLRAQIDGVLKPRPQPNQAAFFGNGQIILRQGGALRIVGGGFAPAAPPAPAPRKDQPKPKPISEEEKKRLAEIDLDDQQKRARELEQSIIELTRRAMELERRVADLRGQIAAAEKR